MAAVRTVLFARINRRNVAQLSLGDRSFSDDMRALAEARNTEAVIEDIKYVAADLTTDPSGDFMTGVLGFTETDQLVDFDDASYSWMKGPGVEASGASLRRNLVPFAVDLREGKRWVAFATTRTIKARRFVDAFAAALNHAVEELNLLPTEWEVDLVTSTSTIRQWVSQHDDISVLIRVVRLSNPRDLDDKRAKMRALGAARSQEQFTPKSNETLDLAGNEEFEELLEGTETGDTEITMKSRSGDKFSTANRPDSETVPDFGTDLARGVEVVLGALRTYVAAGG